MENMDVITGLISGVMLIIVSGFGIMLFNAIKEIKSDTKETKKDIKDMLIAYDKRVTILEQEQKEVNKSLTKLEALMPTLLSSNESINTAHFEIMRKTIDMSNAIIQKLRFISNAD